jgi:hypothetical protein
MATIYKDSLIEITDTGLTLHRYYFPFGDRYFAFDEFEEIEVLAPSIWRGRWRIWGSGDLRTWFPTGLETAFARSHLHWPPSRQNEAHRIHRRKQRRS